MQKFTTCERCATAIVNDDYSAFDFANFSEVELASVHVNVETMGLAVHVGSLGLGAHECWVCAEDDYGPAHLFESQS